MERCRYRGFSSFLWKPARILTDQHGLAQSVRHADLDVNVWFVESAEVVEDAEVSAADTPHHVFKDVSGPQIVSRPPQDDLVGFEQVNEVKTQRPFDIVDKPVTYKADELLSVRFRTAFVQALEKGEVGPIKLSELDDAQLAVIAGANGSWTAVEKTLTQRL